MDFFSFMYYIQHCLIYRPQISGLLPLRHWQSDAITTRLDLIHYSAKGSCYLKIEQTSSPLVKLVYDKEFDSELKCTGNTTKLMFRYLLCNLRYWSCSCQLRLLDRGHTMAATAFSLLTHNDGSKGSPNSLPVIYSKNFPRPDILRKISRTGRMKIWK